MVKNIKATSALFKKNMECNKERNIKWERSKKPERNDMMIIP